MAFSLRESSPDPSIWSLVAALPVGAAFHAVAALWAAAVWIGRRAPRHRALGACASSQRCHSRLSCSPGCGGRWNWAVSSFSLRRLSPSRWQESSKRLPMVQA